MVISMKLNDKGWGLVAFLLFLAMFFLFLLLIAALINRFNDRFVYINNPSYEEIEKI